MFRSYRLYWVRLEDEKQHAVQMANLHLRTIEALALAIEAKDETTHKHLHRVKSYASEIGKTLNLSHDELEALRAASVLHDIGKLAVPEHIISKPGKLTVDEFEKMKIHPTVGAQILETVQFPYPVVPIVHAHHEKWDGSGYPRGRSGTDIPIGARILAAVDCLDGLGSDRQYRRALPMDEAMAYVVSESGKSFDPEVVTILQQRRHDLEKSIRDVTPKRVKLDTGMKIERGLSPAAGFEQSSGSTTSSHSSSNQMEFLPSIAAARQEAQVLFELSQELGSSLSLNETLSVLDLRLRKLITYDSMVVSLRHEDHLVPEYANGDNLSLFSALRIPLGEGLSGWVAETQKAIINGNPSVEFGYLNDPTKFTILRSALAIPLCGLEGNSGVVALYHKEAAFFQRYPLRILTALASQIALVVQNALRFRPVEMSASTDRLTGLPNATSPFLA